MTIRLPSDSRSPGTPLPLADDPRWKARSGLAPYNSMACQAHVKKQIPEGSAVTGYLSHLTTYGIFKDNWSDNKKNKTIILPNCSHINYKNTASSRGNHQKFFLDLFGNDSKFYMKAFVKDLSGFLLNDV
jgi:hypothetical protein